MPASQSQYSLSDLITRFGLELQGDAEIVINGVATLASAGPGQITFLANPSYHKQLPDTKAAAVILKQEHAASCPTNCVVASNPYLAYARIAGLFDPRPAPQPGVHHSAVISESSRIGKNVSIGAQVVIGDDCDIGDGCSIGPGSVLEAKCCLGEGCRLFANVSVGHGVQLGKRVMIHPGTVIGADGFGIAFDADHWEKVPQVGSVVIGDDCEIGANSCIDRGAVGDTVLEEDVRIDNLVQIGHNVRIGAHTAIAGTSGVSGSVKIGKYCLLGGGTGISGHLEIADSTTITGRSQIIHSIREPGTTWSGTLPASPAREWNRNVARLRKLDEIARKVNAINAQLGKLTEHEK